MFNLYTLGNFVGGGNLVLANVFLNLKDQLIIYSTNFVDCSCQPGFSSDAIVGFNAKYKRRHFYYCFSVFEFCFRLVKDSQRVHVVSHGFYLLPFLVLPSNYTDRVIYVAQDIDYNFYNGVLRFFIRLAIQKHSKYGGLTITTSSTLKDRLSQDGILSISCSNMIENVLKFDCEYFKGKSRDVQYDLLFLLRNGAHKAAIETQNLALRIYLKFPKLRIRIIDFRGSCKLDSGFNFEVSGPLSRIEFLHVLSVTSVYVNLSSWEGFGLPNVEAYLSGCSVVSTPIPSVEYILSKYGVDNLYILDESDDYEAVILSALGY